MFISLVLILFLFSFFVRSVIIFWSVFLLLTLLFVSLIKFYSVYSVVIFNYLIIQEILGYFFIINYVWWVPIFSLFFNLGIPPFHFWVINFCENLPPIPFIWFLLYHKIVYLPVLLSFLGDVLLFLFLGLLFLYLQVFLVSSYRSLLVLVSLESFTWFLSLLIVSIISFFCISLSYLFLLYFSSGCLQANSFVGYTLVLILIGYPLIVGFFFKYLSLVGISIISGYLILLPLLIISFSILSSIHLLFVLVYSFETESLSISSFYSFISFLAILFFLL